jgi:hypothetical protein
MASDAVCKMKQFHDDVVQLYQKHDMDLLDNLGRRNIVMSQAQEKFFAQVLSKKWKKVINDGKTGQPDIVIGELDRELECKLTSRHKSGAISFQSDFETLQKKGYLDYLYVIADHDFQSFGVFHFENLSIDDFRKLSPGARGKVAMKKYLGMKKCNILLGDVQSLNEINLKKLNEKLSQPLTESKRKKIQKSINYWETETTRYKFILESVSQ